MAWDTSGPPWITPTSYGSVVTSISPDRRLIRIYLDTRATDAFERGSAKVDEQLVQRGVDPARLDRATFAVERAQCAELVESNGWSLFSLHPMMLSVQTLESCNARCSFCYASAPDTVDGRTMEADAVFRLKDYAAEHGVKFGISGGEPLLHPRIYDLLEYRADEVFETVITNFTSPQIDLDRYAATNVDLTQVSLHGYGDAHNDVLRIPRAYQRVRDRIVAMRPRINIATNTVITPANIDTIEPLVADLADVQEETGRDLIYVRLVPVLPSGTGFDTYDSTEAFMSEVRTLLTSLRDRFDDVTFEMPMLHPNPYEYFEDPERWTCPAGAAIGVVRVDGVTVPCNQFLDTELTSEHTVWGDFHSVWTGDPRLAGMRSGQSVQGPAAPSCEGCAYMTLKERSGFRRRGSLDQPACGDHSTNVVEGLQIASRV